MTVRKRLVISGRVQGVFFRDTCRRVAEEEKVSGWASNLSDGRVEVALEGDEDAVDRVVQWCREGTDWADVDSIEISDEEPEGASGFVIR
jgi:acylphosphatase